VTGCLGCSRIQPNMLRASDPLYRRIRSHAARKIRFGVDVPKSKRLAGYKRFLSLERGMIVRYHRKGDSGQRVCRAGAILVDVIVESIFRTALLTFSEKHGVLPCSCSLLGLGGYGRGELNPLSDVDIMFLFPDDVKASMIEDMKQVLTDEVLYPLWDLGFKVGHSTRTVKECLEESALDIKTRNSLLESRLILGSHTLHKKFAKSYRDYLDKQDLKPLVAEMVGLQKERRSRFGGSIFATEPNIKNGVGGLREFQGVQWLLHLVYGNASARRVYAHDNLFKREMKAFEEAYDFMLKVRTELHLNSRRATDELTLGVQPMIAENLGYQGTPLERVESFLKDYYYHARNSLRIAKSLEQKIWMDVDRASPSRIQALFGRFLKKRKRQIVDGFVVEGDIVWEQSSDVLDEDPIRIIRLFRLMQTMNLSIAPSLENLLKAKLDLLTTQRLALPEVGEHFRAIVESHGKVLPILEEMHNFGVLEKLIPEFEGLDCYIQHDLNMVRYAEDQKVLNTIGQLDKLLSEPTGVFREHFGEPLTGGEASELYWTILVYSLMYPGILRSGSFRNKQQTIEPKEIFNRFGIHPDRMERIMAFIASHRKVAHFWHQGEPDDSRLVNVIASTLREKGFIKQSLWFHYCEALGKNSLYWDVHAIEPVLEIYERAKNAKSTGGSENTDVMEFASNKEMTRVDIADRTLPGITKEEIDAHFHLLPERYFSSRNSNDVQLHIQLVHQLLETIQQADSLGSLKPIVDWEDDESGEFSVINVVTWDRHGLFYKLSGAISAVGLNILKARAVVRSDHIAIDTFYVRHGKGGKVDSAEKRNEFESSINSILVQGNKARGLVRDQYDRSGKKSTLGRGSRFDVSLPVMVEIYHDEDLGHYVVDYQGNDRIGLLYRISRSLAQEQLNIDSVRISTSNGVASGTIYVSEAQSRDGQTGDWTNRSREKLFAILGSELWLED
jgi:[protein-PII] uridylyltransferase